MAKSRRGRVKPGGKRDRRKSDNGTKSAKPGPKRGSRNKKPGQAGYTGKKRTRRGK